MAEVIERSLNDDGIRYHDLLLWFARSLYSQNHQRIFFLKAAQAAKKAPRSKRRGASPVRPSTIGVHSAQLTLLMLTVLSDTKGHFGCHVEVACNSPERMQFYKMKSIIGDSRIYVVDIIIYNVSL